MRLLGLGARHLDLGQRDVARVLLADPEGNLCCVMEQRAAYAGTGPIALPLDSTDPAPGCGVLVLADRLDRGGRRRAAVPAPPIAARPTLDFCPEQTPKSTSKNRLHVDVRLEGGDDPDVVAVAILERGGQELNLGWGDLPWRHYADPSGNELCVLAAQS